MAGRDVGQHADELERLADFAEAARATLATIRDTYAAG